MAENPPSVSVVDAEKSNSHSRICQKPIDFINTQISDLITSYFKNHVIKSRYFKVFDLMECELFEDYRSWIKFAPQTMDVLKEDDSNLLWKVISIYENRCGNAIKNLMSHIPTTHLFRCTMNLLTLISPNACMSEAQLLEAIANTWFKTNVRNIMEGTTIPHRYAFKHVFIGERVSFTVLGLHHGGRIFLLHESKNLWVTGVSKYHNAHKIIAFSFLWGKFYKRLNTVFFGLPVEFEVLLYFICYFQSRAERFKLLLDQSELTVVVVKRANGLCTAYFII